VKRKECVRIEAILLPSRTTAGGLGNGSREGSSLRPGVRDAALEDRTEGFVDRAIVDSQYMRHPGELVLTLDSTQLRGLVATLRLRFAGDLRPHLALPHVLAPLVCELGAIHRPGSSGLDLAGDPWAGTSIALSMRSHHEAVLRKLRCVVVDWWTCRRGVLVRASSNRMARRSKRDRGRCFGSGSAAAPVS